MDEPVTEQVETNEEYVKRLNDTIDRALALVDKLIKEKDENIRNTGH